MHVKLAKYDSCEMNRLTLTLSDSELIAIERVIRKMDTTKKDADESVFRELMEVLQFARDNE